MSKELEIFDSDYVSVEQTKTDLPKSSEINDFIKDPVEQDDMVKYGTSKPNRIIIKAKITNG